MLSRRQFLKLAGATAALTVPALSGYVLWREDQGESPPTVSPYAAAAEAGESPPGVPILIAMSEQTDNPYGSYLAEILRAEGLNCFGVERLSAINSALLNQVDIVLLTEGMLSTDQIELLEWYVTNGGNIVAMRPDAQLETLLGVERTTGKTSDGYIKVDAEHPVGKGITTKTLQFHGDASHYRLAGAHAVASMFTDMSLPAGYPAVTLHSYGRGQAAMWAYDLAQSIAYTRQGNPAWADQERDHLDGVRPSDMFVGWVNLDRLMIPQADEQQRLLINLLSVLSQATRPLPRLWYFTGAAQGMLIATGDSHQNQALAVDQVLTHVERRGGHMSVYYAPQHTDRWRRVVRKARWWAADLPVVGNVVANPTPFPSPSAIAGWRARGHEFTVHPSVEKGLEVGWLDCWKEFTNLGYGPVSPTVRTHRVLWSGWVETARFQRSHGIRMNMDYYHIGPAFRKESGEWTYGHFTGSGLPIKFVDEDGQILDIYQQLTQLVDEHLIQVPWDTFVALSADEAVRVSEALLDRVLQGSPSAVATNFHIDPFAHSWDYAQQARRWLEGTLDYAAANDIPIWSAEEWLHFTETRHDAVTDRFSWDRSTGQLSFRFTSPPAEGIELAIMLPMLHGQARLATVTVDDRDVQHREQVVGGVHYGWTSVQAGSHQVSATYI